MSNEVRASYDAVAATYTDLVRHELDRHPLERGLLASYAEQVGHGARVLEVGCGPGRITAHLASLGLDASGIDLSPEMVRIARREHPGLDFRVGSMDEVDLPDGELDGVVAWYSLIHVEPDRRPRVFDELRRVLRPGGVLLLAFQVGDEPRRRTDLEGIAVSLTFHRFRPKLLAAEMAGHGFVPVSRTVREPRDEEPTAQGFLVLRAV